MADWVSGTAAGVPLALAVSDLPTGSTLGLQLELDSPSTAGTTPEDLTSIEVNTPTTQGLVLATELVAPGRLRATLPESGTGLYTFQVSTPNATQRQLHRLRHHAEDRSWGTSPKLDTWQREGLIKAWDPHDQNLPPASHQGGRVIQNRPIARRASQLVTDVLACEETEGSGWASRGRLSAWQAVV